MEEDPDVMVTYFETVKTQVNDSNSYSVRAGLEPDMSKSWSTVDYPSMGDIKEAKRELKTPRKRSMGEFLSESIDTIPMDLPPLRKIGGVGFALKTESKADYDPSKLTEDILKEWQEIGQNFTTLETEINKRGRSECDYRESLTKTLMEMEAVLHGTQSKVHLLASQIGSQPSDKEGQGMENLWEVVANNREKFSKIMHSLEESERLRAVDSSNNTMLTQQVKNLQGSFTNLVSSYKKIIPSFKQRLSSLESSNIGSTEMDFDNLFDAMDTKPDLGEKMANLTRKMQEAHSDLVRQVESLTRKLDNQPSTGVVSLAEFRRISKTVDDLDSQIQSNVTSDQTGYQLLLQSQVDDLRQQILEMQSRVDDESFSLNHYKFGSFQELKRWVKEEKVESAGIFWDLFSLIVAMEPKAPTGTEHSDARHSAIRVASSRMESELAASMYHTKPKLLYSAKGTGKPVAREKGFGAIPSYGAWLGEGTESIKQSLQTWLHDYAESIRGTIDSSTGGGAFALALLQEVESQWTSFASHVERTYSDLVHVSHFSPTTAFQLIGRASNAIWEAMRKHRTKVIMLDNLSSLDCKARMIWCVLQCHREMQSFVSMEFRSHPSYVKEMSMFMLTERVDPSQLSTIDNTLTQLNKKVGTLATLPDMFKDLRRDHDNLRHELVQYKKLNGELKKKAKRDD